MKTYSVEQLQEVIRLHTLWLNGDTTGQQADLSEADLSEANLSGADLSGADLSGADLSEANLSKANLSKANLSGADLSWADLSGADLSGADLSWADLSKANLSGANLSEANLSEANLSEANLSAANLSEADLSGADLSGANLSGADLSGANLSGANLFGADLSGIDLAKFCIVPEVGAFQGFKKLSNGCIAHIEIPDTAERVGGLVGRKCRAESAIVLSITDNNGKYILAPVASQHDPNFMYEAGKTVIPDAWNNDERVECAQGIHFFLSLSEAETY
jgi:hypothetical protein